MQNYRNGEEIVVGNYILICMKLLGQGSFGMVYQVCDYNNQQKIYALKIQEGMSDEEAKITQIIKEKNPKGIVKIYEFIKQNNSYLILMEYLPKNFYEIISTQVISEVQIRNIYKQLAETVKSLHDLNIAHRDLKPENILVENIGQLRNQLTFKLCDFGISKFETQELFKTINIGTPYYQAPEQLDNVCFDKSVDIWALGAIFYEIITKKPLFDGSSIQQVQNLIRDKEYSVQKINLLQIPQDFKDLILKMVEFDVSKRITLDKLIEKLKARIEKSPMMIQQNNQTHLKPSSQRLQNIQQPFNNEQAQKNDIEFQKKNQFTNSEKKQIPQKIFQQDQINQFQSKSNFVPASHNNGTMQVVQKVNGIHQPNINKQQMQNNQQVATQSDEKYFNNKLQISQDIIPFNNNQKVQNVPFQNIQTVQLDQKQKQPSNYIPKTNQKIGIINNPQSDQQQIKQQNNPQEGHNPKIFSAPQQQSLTKPINANEQLSSIQLPQQDQQKFEKNIKIVAKQQDQIDLQIKQSNQTQQSNAEIQIGVRQSRVQQHQQNSPKKINPQQSFEQNVPIMKDIQNPPITLQNQNNNLQQQIQIQNTRIDNGEHCKDQANIQNNNEISIKNIGNNLIPQTVIKPISRVGQSQPPINNQLNTIQYPINSSEQQGIQKIKNIIPQQNYFPQQFKGNGKAYIQLIPPSYEKIVGQSNTGQNKETLNILPIPPNSNILKGRDIKPMDSKIKQQDDRSHSQNQSNKIQFQQSYQPFVIGGLPRQ